MKKFFTLIACALVAGSAFAQDVELVKQVDASFDRKSNENADEMKPFISVEFVNDEATKEAMGKQHQARVVKDPADVDLSDRLANWCIEIKQEETREPDIDPETGEQKTQWGQPKFTGTDWDSQFFISLPNGITLEAGTEVTFSMRVKAQRASTKNAAAQGHRTPGDYKAGDIGIGSIEFTTDWVKIEKTWTVTSDQDGCGTMAINLACDLDPNTYYFDDIQWSTPVPKVYTWKKIFESDGTDAAPFSVKYFRNYTDAAKSENGAIVVTSLEPDKEYTEYYYSNDEDTEEQQAILGRDWDTQFLIPLTTDLVGGEKFKITFKYKADKAATVQTQAHTAAPEAGFIEGANHSGAGTYIHYQLLGDLSFTDEWNIFNETLETVTSVPDAATAEKPMGSVCFNLSVLRESINYYFDDIAVYVREEVPTAISEAKVQKAAKTIYNVAGQQIQSLQKGLNIVNGQKVYVK